MRLNIRITRKEFVQSTLALAALAVGGAACGDDTGGAGGGGTGGAGGGSGTTTGTTTTGGTTTTTGGGGSACTSAIAANHGHELEISQADVDAGLDVSFDIMGTSPHTHSVVITGDQFTTLAGGGEVEITSTEGGAHTHVVTISACS